jgi:Cu(I)/Ag(I) efflux system membrane fusion protein
MKRIFLAFLIFANLAFAFKIEQEFNIKTIQVESKNISNYKEFYGRLQADKSKVYDLNLRFDGFITKLYADKDYMYINKGDKLFDIYSKEIYNLYDELKIAKNSSDRIYRSVKNKIELFDIDVKDKNKDNTTLIKSKFSGYITKHNINKGSYVKAGQDLFELTDLSTLWLIINVYQKDIEFIKEGMSVEVKIDGVAKLLSSTVEKIYPTINPKDQSVPVRVVLENKDLTLFPNMFAKARVFEKAQTILIVPKNAVVQRDGKQYVFMKEGKEYVPSEVVATRIPEGYKISEGLEEGDVIVTNALFLLDSDAITNGLYSDDW